MSTCAGFEPLGQPHRKPKHFEVLGRRNHRLTELHVEFTGNIRKMKPVEEADPKWSEALEQPV
jgi:DNA-binding sugar fermentation-stimulating protein